MIGLAIDILWLVLGIVILLGVVWLALYALAQFGVPIPENVRRGIYLVALLLIVIAALSMLAGGSIRAPSFR